MDEDDEVERFTGVVRAHHGQVLAYLVRRVESRPVAEDLTAETFVVAWRRWSEVPEPVLPWLYGVARGLLYNERRKSVRRLRAEGQVGREQVRFRGIDADPGVRLPEADRVVRALAALSESDRELLMLVGWEPNPPRRSVVRTEPTPVRATGRLVRDLQERTARAFPAACRTRLDGWWLRHGDGGAWWARSVLPHGDVAPADLPGRIRYVEEFYARRGAPARFQVSPGACPPGLDDALAGRGYRVETPLSLRTAPTARVIDRLPPGEPRIRVDDGPTDAWFQTWLAVHGADDDPAPERDMLRRVDRPSAYVSALAGADVIAVGRAVADAGWAGVFGMGTLSSARGAGAGGSVLAALAGWAADHGAAHLYLQVERENAAARRLYERAGFAELCRYHYRTAPAPIERHSSP